jgi:gamma-glutamylcyclotransferase (GGCT)/AIG2-like uncharacterized protein YtfP
MTLFSYGSLVFPEVMRAVTGRSFAHEPARLADWVRLRVRGASYPGLRARAGASTLGVLWHEVDPASLARLDRFEGTSYARRTLRVRTSRGEKLQAEVYVWSETELARLSAEPWDPARFARESLRGFLRALTRR